MRSAMRWRGNRGARVSWGTGRPGASRVYLGHAMGEAVGSKVGVRIGRVMVRLWQGRTLDT